MFDGGGNGWLEIISGPMFAGKSTELIRRLRTLEHTKINFVLFKPKIDSRYADNDVVTHDNSSMSAKVVNTALDILDFVRNNPTIKVIGIDEGQFFGIELVSVIKELVFQQGKRVIISALLLDYQDNPFGYVPHLLPYANEHIILHAVCSFCNEKLATHTVRISGSGAQIEVGGVDKYKVACNDCWREMKKK